jgi:Uma2 family endonuclease
MVAVAKLRLYTPEEYLILEEKAETRSEYHNGVIVAMAGASPEHSKITHDLITELGVQLRGSRCQGFTEQTRVWVEECRKYYYPDYIVVCGEPEYQRIRGLSSLLNPTVLFEILSDSTEAADRGEKFACYRTLPSLMTYVLISQDRPRVEVFQRQSDNSWRYTATEGLESVVTLDTIGCSLPFSELYARITFPPRLVEEEDESDTADEE